MKEFRVVVVNHDKTETMGKTFETFEDAHDELERQHGWCFDRYPNVTEKMEFRIEEREVTPWVVSRE